ncbi:MAG: CvpA family protein [Clostridia bacterium]|nr:CvpA family protein [Clostridia bacterium]
MQIIDYVIIAIAVIALIIGLIRGLISQVMVLLGIVAVAVGTSYLFRFPMQWLSGVITNEKVCGIVAIIVTVIVLSLIYGVIAHFVKKPFKSIKVLKAVDKILGAVLGLAVAYSLVAIFVAALTRTDIEIFAKLSTALQNQTENSAIINSVYSNNFFGNWILDVIGQGINYAMGLVK